MPLYEYYCEDYQKGFILLQSVSVNKRETLCPECSSSNVYSQMFSFASKIPPRTGTNAMKAGPVTADELPNKSILNLPIPKHVSEYHN
jgi:putative FmdB family regulatory protein